MATTTELDIAWLVEFPGYVPPPDAAGAPVRFWSGEGDLEFAVDGTVRTWTGTVAVTTARQALVQAAPVQNVRHGAPARAKVRVLVGTGADELRHLIVRADPGPLPVLIHFIYRATGADAWTKHARQRKGRLSNGQFVRGAYEYDLETYGGDGDRQTPKRWAHESQRLLHPGDGFFKFTADLAQGTEVRWPQSS